MKALLLTGFVALSLGVSGQGIPAAPTAEAINLRLEKASVEMRKAAWSRNTSIYWLVAGSAMTLASHVSNGESGDVVPLAMGGLTFAGFAVFQIKGSGHDRRASVSLHP